jgi:hypothetical protein
MIGEIITAGAGLLGSLFGKKKQTTETTVNYGKMVASATAAGFNPLTALRNGGSAGFTTTTSPTVSQIPGALASLGGALGEAFEKKTDPLEQKKRQLDTALVDYQLRQLKEGPKAMSGRLYPGATFVGAKVTAAKPHMSGDKRPGEGKIVGGDDPTVSSMGWGGGRYGWFHNPYLPDAAAWEQIYGDNEIGSTLYGGTKFLGDTAYSVYRNGKEYFSGKVPEQPRKSRVGKYSRASPNPTTVKKPAQMGKEGRYQR